MRYPETPSRAQGMPKPVGRSLVFLSPCLKRFDTSTFLLYTLCFVRGLFTQAVAGHAVVSRVVGRIFTPGTLHDGLGVRSGRIWDASPAKPSKPLQIDAKSVVLPLGVRAEFLAGLRIRSSPFSVVCAR